jgi:hypothetical protein
MQIAVGIASAGRPQMLREVLGEIGKQSRLPDGLIVCVPGPEDAPQCPQERPIPEIIFGPRGLTRQRNEILRHAAAFDIMVFFDDDFVPERSYLAEVEDVFTRHADVALVTGLVIADGILGPGLDIGAARSLLAADRTAAADQLDDVLNGYGCNMAIRLAPVLAHGYSFDERLPLYGWLEDLDFSRQLAGCGRIVKMAAARGVHLGVKGGRQSGRRLGYSQIANPLYLVRKGTCPWRTAARLISRNLAANCVRSFRPEPYIDRVGRVVGNLMAVCDLVGGRLDPQRILKM